MSVQHVRGRLRRVRPWWRPLAYSAAAVAAIAALFNPLPALADPAPPPAVPDTGARPVLYGNLVLPGQQTSTPSPSTITPIPGVVTTPLLAKIEKGRAEITTLGEQLTRLTEERDLTQTQVSTANQKVIQAQAAVTLAEGEVEAAATAALRDAAAMPSGELGSGLRDLDSLARINRGDSATEQAASRQLGIAQAAHAAALAEQQAASAHLTDVTAQHTKLQAEIAKKSAAQQKLEAKHADELAAAEAAQAARDARAGADYLDGENAGRGADPRAIAALTYALAQRGDPYVWSEEGPGAFDCSGLMYAAYRSDAAGNFPLTRVSRDQYRQTSARTVDRYSLLQGDLLFFSSSNSWTGIHHVAMYAGNGMMVEAPRTGLNVRLVPVRWTRLFAATRIYGSIEGTVEGPNLGTPDNPDAPSDNPPKTTDPTKPPATPTSPATSKPTSAPTSKPTSKPSTPNPSGSTPTPTPTTPSPTPTTKPADPEPTPTASSSRPAAVPSSTSPESSSGSSSNGSSSSSSSGSASSSSSTSSDDD